MYLSFWEGRIRSPKRSRRQRTPEGENKVQEIIPKSVVYTVNYEICSGLDV